MAEGVDVPSLLQTTHTPKQITSLAVRSTSDLLFAGSDDGCLRIYQLGHSRVLKAIKTTAEISSILPACSEQKSLSGSQKYGQVWFASGTEAFLFDADVDKLILTGEDALKRLQLGEDSDDVLNELSLSPNGDFLAFSTDSGCVGVVDLSSQIDPVYRMRKRHDNVCGSVTFIPDRPGELVSGGYDSALLHFDFRQRSVLSRFDIVTSTDGSNVQLALPFILSMVLSPDGLVVVSTANGYIWIGAGGKKTPLRGNSKTRRSRRWGGLSETDGCLTKIAEGPVVAVFYELVAVGDVHSFGRHGMPNAHKEIIDLRVGVSLF